MAFPPRTAGHFAEGGAVRTSPNPSGRCAVKADGLALGKGVLLCNTVAEASPGD